LQKIGKLHESRRITQFEFPILSEKTIDDDWRYASIILEPLYFGPRVEKKKQVLGGTAASDTCRVRAAVNL